MRRLIALPRHLMLATVVGACALALASSSSAAQATGTTREAQARRTIIDMDVEVIEGGLHQPDHDIVRAPVKRGFRNLIQIRKEFRREVLASAEQL